LDEDVIEVLVQEAEDEGEERVYVLARERGSDSARDLPEGLVLDEIIKARRIRIVKAVVGNC
jgi:riboflavin synthase